MQNTLRPLLSRHEKKVRFLIAGGVNTIVGLSTYPIVYILLNPFGIGYIKALFLASIISVNFSFFTSKYYVFKTKGNIKKEYTKYFLFYGFYLLLNLICLPFLVEIVKIPPVTAQTLFSVFIIITSYFWHKFITFKRSK